MAAAFPPTAACAMCAGVSPRSAPSGPAGTTGLSNQRIECLALSLVLHAILAVWASRNAPHVVARAQREDASEVQQFTISVNPDRSRGREEEVAVLVQESVAPPIPPPDVAASAPPGAEEQPPALAPPPAPAVEPEPTLALVPPSFPAAPAAAPLEPERPPPDETAEEEAEVASAPAEEPPPPEPAAATPPPPEGGAPEGSVEEKGAPSLDLPTLAELERGQQAAREPEKIPPPAAPAPGPAAEAAATPEPAREPEVSAPPVLGPGPGQLTPPRPAERPPAPPPGPASPPAEAEANTSERGAGQDPARDGQEGASQVEALMQDPELLARARTELEGQHKGLTTVLLAAPEDQLEIARFFGEEIVLVPRTTLDPGVSAPRYYRLTEAAAPGVEMVASMPPLGGRRQYRDLFDYEYARLPVALRDLRRCVPSREDVYLFAALISPAEWALVIARRQEALARAGRELSEVRQCVLRYARRQRGSFDLSVAEIVFHDGSRVRPSESGQGVRSR